LLVASRLGHQVGSVRPNPAIMLVLFTIVPSCWFMLGCPSDVEKPPQIGAARGAKPLRCGNAAR
jgi:hypothetical protein